MEPAKKAPARAITVRPADLGPQATPLATLARLYGGQIDPTIASELAWVRELSDRIELALKDGTRIWDDGASVEADDLTEASASTIVEIAIARGWRGLAIEGDEQAKADLWLAAQRRGLEVTNFRPPAAVRQIWEAEKAARRAAAKASSRPRLSMGDVLTRPATRPGAVPPVAPPASPPAAPPSSVRREAPRPAALTAEARAVEVLGQARADELARRRQGSSIRPIPAAPSVHASAADRAAWVEAAQRQIRDARGRLQQMPGTPPLRTLDDARRHLIAAADAAQKQAKAAARETATALAEHQTERPGAVARWLGTEGAATWQAQADVLAQQHGAAAVALDAATEAHRERARRLASPSGEAAILRALDRSRLGSELQALQVRDLTAEVREIERRVRSAQSEWAAAPEVGLTPREPAPL